MGKPVLFIPSPNVAEDHQKINAEFISKKEAAILIEESELDLKFENKFSKLLSSNSFQNNLKNNLKKLAKISATEDILDEVDKLLDL